MSAWNKGFTKDTHPSLRKTSETMRRKKLNNFRRWQDAMREQGIFKTSYPPLAHNGNLAELLGVILGDGSLYKHDRCDSLRIVGDASKMEFVHRSAYLIHAVFDKQPRVAKRAGSNGVNITLYERNIAKRLHLPYGSRAQYQFRLPEWIRKDKAYTIRFLRGLYEAEGCIAHHAGTYTHKLIFANTNQFLLALVAELVRNLGFTVSISTTKVQVSRKLEVQNLADLIQFRRYEA